MDVYSFLEKATRAPGPSGMEQGVAQVIADAFRACTDNVSIDAMNNVIARMGEGGPRILLTAHQDEIGLLVTQIEQDGCLRIARNGGVDPRILPSARVTVRGKDRDYLGVVGAKPPHLLTEAARKETVRMEDLYVDIGYPPEAVRERVRVGDAVLLRGEPLKLLNDRIAGKTMDDRACVAILLMVAERLSQTRTPCELVFLSASQEEVGGYGAKTGAFGIEPDMAVVIDVTHGDTPGASKWQTVKLHLPVIERGSVIHPALFDLARSVAKDEHIDVTVKASAGSSRTDADEVQITGNGIPLLLLGLPLKYMHSSVEMLDMAAVRETARLVERFVERVAQEWGNIAWN